MRFPCGKKHSNQQGVWLNQAKGVYCAGQHWIEGLIPRPSRTSTALALGTAESGWFVYLLLLQTYFYLIT